MIWNKKRYKPEINKGYAKIETDPIFGVIEHLLVLTDLHGEIVITDSDNDIIYANKIRGRLDDRCYIPIGQQSPESLRIKLNVYKRKWFIKSRTFQDKPIVILKIREK